MALLAGILYGCSNEVGGEDSGDDPPTDGKVTLTMTVRTTPLSGSGDTDPWLEQEQTISSLYVFIFNIGTSQYCEAKRFSVYDMKKEADGKYTVEMEVTPGYKRFYLIANPGIEFRPDLESYTQAELQNLKTMTLEDHEDDEGDYLDDGQLVGLLPDQIMEALKAGKGVPMSMSVLGQITLDKKDTDSGGPLWGTLVLDNGADAFSLVRVVAKVHLVCRVKKELQNSYLDLDSLKIQNANRSTFLLPKYTVKDGKWLIDFRSMTEAADLTRTVGYVYGKQENNTANEWLEYDRGTHYFYENYFGPAVAGDVEEGLTDETKYSRIHVVMNDGRDKTFVLPYLKRNDYLTVTISMTASNIICDIKPWENEDIYPDYTDKIN